jgi:CheY-like chemotaxis protein
MANDTLPASRPCAILVVENNQDAAATMARLLACFGHKVTIASDGVEALRVAEETQPDVVLLDIGLPKLDGWEVAKALRGRPGVKRPLLIAFTGYADSAARQRSLEAGIDFHLVKPVDIEHVLPLITDWVSNLTNKS